VTATVIVGMAIVVAAVVLGAMVTGIFNRLVTYRNRYKNAFAQIEVQLKRRHDLIPNLVDTVKGAMQFERETLDAVITARNQAISIERGGAGVAATAQAESQLSAALGRLFAVVEAYPQLKATGNVSQLQEELTSTENRIAFARQHYNDVSTQYNTKQQQFPTNLVAGLARATPAELWEITDAAERAVPKVDLSLRPGVRA
jgi:LemA protein